MNSDRWGLDPLFSAHWKLNIRDIQELNNTCGIGVFDYRGRPVCSVEVCGIIVRLEERERFSAYTVDDGTGTIECIKWNNHDGTMEQRSMDGNELDQVLTNKWMDVKACDEYDDSIQLGDLLTVHGKIRIFRGNRQISCQSVRVETDPMYEAFYWAQMVDLYQNFYTKPDNEIVDTSPRVQLECQIRSQILATCLRHTVQTVTLENLLKMPEIQQLSQKTESDSVFKDVIHSVLKRLEQEGHLCRKSHSHDATYLVVSANEDLRLAVVEILKQEGEKTKYQETGCHYLHVYEELRKLLDYSQVTKEAVLSCLQTLESRSDVISVDPGRYTCMQL